MSTETFRLESRPTVGNLLMIHCPPGTEPSGAWSRSEGASWAWKIAGADEPTEYAFPVVEVSTGAGALIVQRTDG